MSSEELKEHALKGESLGELAAYFKVSRQRIFQRLHSSGVYSKWKELRDAVKPPKKVKIRNACAFCQSELPFHKIKYCCVEHRNADVLIRQRERYQNDSDYRARLSQNHANWRQRKDDVVDNA